MKSDFRSFLSKTFVYGKKYWYLILVFILFACLFVQAGGFFKKSEDKKYSKLSDKIVVEDNYNSEKLEDADLSNNEISTDLSTLADGSDNKKTTSSSKEINQAITGGEEQETSPTLPDGNNSSPDPEPEQASAFVAFYADNQSDSDDDDLRHQNVINRILASGANPVIHAGDLMEDGTQNSFDRFVNVAGILLGSRTFYGALGNNDRLFGDSTTPSAIFLDYFNFPNNEKWYSVNSGNLHLIILDSAFSASSPDQISWLVSDLQSVASQSRITAVVFHHPTFFSTIQSYLINYGVDFVVCGHIHTYTKTDVSGIKIFTLPGGTAIGHATSSIYNDYATVSVYDQNGLLLENTRIDER